MGSSGMPQTGVELVAANLQGFLGDLQRGNQAVDAFGKTTEDVGQRTSSAGQIMIGALRRVGELAVDSLGRAARAVIGFGQDSLRIAGDFDDGMNQFRVAAGQDLDAQGFEEFHDLFIQLGKDLPVSTTEVQQAAIEMVKGGIDPAILAAGGLKNNIQFAAAAMGGDLVQAAEISSKIVAGWADVSATAEERAALLAKAQDLLTKAANASSVNVHELSLGLFNVQATAKNAGIPLEDVTTVLGELAGDFASSAEAGNSLANFITRIQPTTKSATEAMQSLNLITADGQNVFFDAEGRFVGFREASEILKNALEGLNDQQRTSIMQTIFQKDAMGVAAGLASRGAEGYDQMAASMGNAMGVAEAGTTVQAGYNTAVQNAQGGLEALKITLGEKLLPYMTEFYNFVSVNVLSVLTDLASAVFGDQQAMENLSPTMAGIATALQGFGGTLQVFIEDAKVFGQTLFDWVGGAASFEDVLATLSPELAQYSGLITGVASAVQQLGTFIVENIEPILAIGAALGGLAIISTIAGWISGLIGTVAALGAAFTAAGGGIAGVVAILGGPVTLAVAAVVAGVALLTAAWTNNWFDIQGKTQAVWNFIQPIFQVIAEWVQERIPIATAAASTAVTMLSDVWNNVLYPALQVVGNFIGEVILPIYAALFEVAFAIAKKEIEFLAALWNNVLYPAFQKAATYIEDNVLPIFQSFGSWLSETFGPTIESVTGWLGDVTGGMDGITGAVKGVITWLGNLADSISNLELPDWLTPGSPTPWEIALYGIGKALRTSVAPGLAEMDKGLSTVGKSLTDSEIIEGMAELGADAMEGFEDGLMSGVRSVVKAAREANKRIQDEIDASWERSSPSKWMERLGTDITAGMLSGMQALMPGMLALIDATNMAMKDALTKNREERGQEIDEMAEEMTGKVEDLTTTLNDLISESFGATASIDRQMAKNLDKLMDMEFAPFRQRAQEELALVAEEAKQFADPQQGAKYYKMRSDAIFDLLDLEEQMRNSIDDPERYSQLAAKYELIARAQENELASFKASNAAQTNPYADLASDIMGIMSGNELAGKLPGELESDIVRQLMELMRQLTALAPGNGGQGGYYGPPASPEQQQGVGMYYANRTTTTNYNMPVYTNQSPSVLSQGLALVGALSQ